MKKITVFVVLLATLFTIAACSSENNTNITAAFDAFDITYESIEFEVEVSDPENEITGDTYVKLYLDDEVESTETLTFSEEDDDPIEVSFTNLDPDTSYELKVIATVGKKNVEIISKTVKTFAQTDIYIETAEDFFDMANNKAGSYILSNDIDFSDVDFEMPFTSGKSFSGSFDGQGYTLKNITFTEIGSYTGVFGYVTSATITNLNLDNITIGTEETPIERNSSTRLSFLAGYVSSSSAEITNVHVSNSEIHVVVDSSLDVYVGGIAGYLYGEVQNVSVTDSIIDVKTVSTSDVKIGGIVGEIYTNGTLSKASMTGEIKYELLGEDFDDTDNHSINIGGVVGRNVSQRLDVNIQDVYSTANITSTTNYQITETNETNVTGAIYAINIGGLFGDSSSKVENGFYGGSISFDHMSGEFESNVSKLVNIGGLFGSYSERDALDSSVIRIGNEQTIIVNADEDDELNVHQLIASNLYDTQHGIGVYGSQNATVNGVDIITLVNEISDVNLAFTSDWIKDAYASVYPLT